MAVSQRFLNGSITLDPQIGTRRRDVHELQNLSRCERRGVNFFQLHFWALNTEHLMPDNI